MKLLTYILAAALGIIIVTAIAIGVLGAVAYAAVSWTGLPEVHISHSTGKCVEVRDIDNKYSCSNPPAKYDQVWVK